MRATHSAGVVLAWMIGGCVAADPIDHGEGEGEASETAVERGASTPPGEERAQPGCNGVRKPSCAGAVTGASCDLPCLGGGEVPLECGLERTCHADGRTYGLAAHNAVLYFGSAQGVQNVQSDFEEWILEHPADLGLAPGLTLDDLELSPIAGHGSSAGPLTLFRFAQTYHGMPVLAPDGIVTLVYGPQGAVAITGAIIDGRTLYDHRDVQASADVAVRSMLVHASAHSGTPLRGLEVVHASPVALPRAQAIGWAGFVRHAGGAPLARVIVAADPALEGSLLPLWSFRPLVVSGLADTQAIQARALDPSGEPTSHAYADQTTLTTGAPLLGSVDDVSLDLQLATERVVLLDLNGQSYLELASEASRVLDPTGTFLSNGDAELSMQTAYHLVQSGYDFIDRQLTDPLTGAKQWDSANLLYTHGMLPSDTPAGTFAPRVFVFSNTSAADCPVTGVACATHSGYFDGAQPASEFPELAHTPAGATVQETTGSIILPGHGIEPVTLAHELGHIVDLFTGGGITQDLTPECGGPACPLQCLEDTTDEAPPLTESIAQLLALDFLLQSFEGAKWPYCSIVDLVSRNGSKPWTPGPCIPPDEDISLFVRTSDCPKSSPYCDKPAEPGVRRECCFDDEDLTECTLIVPSECPLGAVAASGGLGTGTARVAPTGSCDARPGYRTNSLYQAFWQWLNGYRCEPTAPFACASVSWTPALTPRDATTAAFLYALRINALTYAQLFDAMAVYVSCTYGAAAYDDFNAVACAHGIRDCAAPAPMVCQTCGNGVREGSETCDGSDWLHASCEALPEYSGGELRCDLEQCTLDVSECLMPGLDSTAGAQDLGESTTTAAEDTDDPGATSSDPHGCDCRDATPSRGWIVGLPLAVLGFTRRRRSA